MKILNEGNIWEELLKLSKLPLEEVFISTYGLYAEKDFTYEILSRLNSKKIKTKILIGISEYSSCKADKSKCVDCELKYKNQIARLNKYINDFKNLEFKKVYNHHLKLFYFKTSKNEYLITGGINFTNSLWTDSSILLKNSEEISEYKSLFMNSWEDKDSKILFGKHRNKTLSWVKKNDKNYFRWMLENKLITQ